MKIALITDLHANREALQAVLDHAHAAGVERHAFLGDLVGYGADPAWVVDTVRRHVRDGAIAVKGNHDEAAAQGPTKPMREEALQTIEWTRSKLSGEQLDFLAGLPLSQRLNNQLYVHANAWAPPAWAYVADKLDAARSLLATDCRYTFCGHVHDPRLYNLAGNGKLSEFVPAAGAKIETSPRRQWLVIPGAAGQPRDGNPAACYALFDDAQSLLWFHRVPYDHASAAGKIRAAKLPEVYARRLIEGQ